MSARGRFSSSVADAGRIVVRDVSEPGDHEMHVRLDRLAVGGEGRESGRVGFEERVDAFLSIQTSHERHEQLVLRNPVDGCGGDRVELGEVDRRRERVDLELVEPDAAGFEPLEFERGVEEDARPGSHRRDAPADRFDLLG